MISDNLNKSQGPLWVAKKLLGEIYHETTTVILVCLPGDLSNVVN